MIQNEINSIVIKTKGVYLPNTRSNRQQEKGQIFGNKFDPNKSNKLTKKWGQLNKTVKKYKMRGESYKRLWKGEKLLSSPKNIYSLQDHSKKKSQSFSY